MVEVVPLLSPLKAVAAASHSSFSRAPNTNTVLSLISSTKGPLVGRTTYVIIPGTVSQDSSPMHATEVHDRASPFHDAAHGKMNGCPRHPDAQDATLVFLSSKLAKNVVSDTHPFAASRGTWLSSDGGRPVTGVRRPNGGRQRAEMEGEISHYSDSKATMSMCHSPVSSYAGPVQQDSSFIAGKGEETSNGGRGPCAVSHGNRYGQNPAVRSMPIRQHCVLTDSLQKSLPVRHG